MLNEFNAGLRASYMLHEYHKRLKEGRYKFTEKRYFRSIERDILKGVLGKVFLTI